MTSVTFTLPTTRSGIYIVKRDGAVLYVGQTVNIWQRVLSHHIAKPGDQLEFHPCPINELDTNEKAAIEHYRPPHNFAGVTRPYSGKGLYAYRHRGRLYATRAGWLRAVAADHDGLLPTGILRSAGILTGSYLKDPEVRAAFIEPDHRRSRAMFWSVDRVIAHLDERVGDDLVLAAKRQVPDSGTSTVTGADGKQYPAKREPEAARKALAEEARINRECEAMSQQAVASLNTIFAPVMAKEGRKRTRKPPQKPAGDAQATAAGAA